MNGSPLSRTLRSRPDRSLKAAAVAPVLLLLGGCQAVVLHPAGDVAARLRDLLVAATGLMLLIILPVMAATVLFAWKYRASNAKAKYAPDWDHSTHLELLIWAAPLMIIICLGALTWSGTHLLDPYRPLSPGRGSSPRSAEAPLDVQVVALDWKWLFFYPQYGVATVNELDAPQGRPITFHITASSVMNSFFIPALAGQIYAMPGMETTLHARMGRAGTFQGLSAHYSGAGFSGMRFAFRSLPAGEFDRWIAGVRASPLKLDRDAYLALARPSEAVGPIRYAAVEPRLYDAVLNECVEPGKMCLSQMMAVDARGGLGLSGARATLPLNAADPARKAAVFGGRDAYVAAVCTAPAPPTRTLGAARPARADSAAAAPPLRGAGLPQTAAPFVLNASPTRPGL